MTCAPDGAQRPAALSAAQAAELAQRSGLKRLGGRPPFPAYVRDLIRRRSFLWTLSRAQAEQENAEDRLGIAWTLLNPLFLVVSYFLIFGLLLDTRRGVDNFVGFLSIGVVIFGFSSSAITTGAKAIIGNMNLVRALRFPRAILPLSVTLTEALMVLPAILVLFIVMLVTKEPPALTWLLLPVALVLQFGILSGLVLMGARLLNVSRDLGNLIPVGIRLLRYVSGVFFSLAVYTQGAPAAVRWGLEFQPLSLPISLARQALMQEYPIVWTDWGIAALWAAVLLVGGLWIFWRDEARYGRA